MGASTEATRVTLWGTRALVVARLGRVGLHAHAAPALLIGLDGAFRVRPATGTWRSLTQAQVPAGLHHELDCEATTMLVLYLAPGRADARALAERWDLKGDELMGFDDGGRARAVGLAYRNAAIDLGALSREIDGVIGQPEPDHISDDRRVDALAREIVLAPDAQLRLEVRAKQLGLSASRLRHLFRAEAGISLRELRRWQRMRGVGLDVADGRSLTEAALARGFSDSAQLSRDFRAAFGIPPSRVFGPQTAVRVLGGEDRA